MPEARPIRLSPSLPVLAVRDLTSAPQRQVHGHDRWMNLYGEGNPTEPVAVPHSCLHRLDEQAGLRPARRISYARIHSTEQSRLRDAAQDFLEAGVVAAHIHIDQDTRAPAAHRAGWLDAVADLRVVMFCWCPRLRGLLARRASFVVWWLS